MGLTVAELRKKHEDATAAAKKAHGEFVEARKPIAADDFDLKSDRGQQLYAKAEELGNSYATLEGEAKSASDELIRELTMKGLEVGDLGGKSPFEADANGARKALASLLEESPGSRVTESDGYKAMIEDGNYARDKTHFRMDPAAALTRSEHIFQLKSGMEGLEAKTLATSFGAPGTELLRPTRLPGFLPLLQPKLQLRNLISVGAIDNNALEWVKMTAITNNAAEVAEASASSGSSGAKPESGFEFEIESTTVKTIAHYIPATRAALADMAQLQTIIDSLLLDGVARRLNTQILAGDGSAPNLRGILNTSGIQSQAASADRKIDRVLKAITKIRLAFLEPSAILMNPLDFQDIRLKQDGIGQYLFGPPSQAGQTTLWGLPVVEDSTVDAGQPVVADWSQAILYVREDVNVLATDSHSDWFTRNLIAILAEGRYALAVPRPDAFCEVDFATADVA